MALDALLRLERILAVVTGTARLPFVHILHCCLEFAGFEREYLGVAVYTLVHAEMEIMAEFCLTGISLEFYVRRLVTFVALVALTGNGEGILAVVATAA